MFSAFVEEFWGALLKGWPQPSWGKETPPPSETGPDAHSLDTEPAVFAGVEVAGIRRSLALEFEEDAETAEDEEAAPDWPVISAEELAAARSRAEAEALSGPHRVFPSSPAGPGSLFEALKRLEEAGRVTSRFVDDPASGPHLAYIPL